MKLLESNGLNLVAADDFLQLLENSLEALKLHSELLRRSNGLLG
jgi:hypothetical protein